MDTSNPGPGAAIVKALYTAINKPNDTNTENFKQALEELGGKEEAYRIINEAFFATPELRKKTFSSGLRIIKGDVTFNKILEQPKILGLILGAIPDNKIYELVRRKEEDSKDKDDLSLIDALLLPFKDPVKPEDIYNSSVSPEERRHAKILCVKDLVVILDALKNQEEKKDLLQNIPSEQLAQIMLEHPGTFRGMRHFDAFSEKEKMELLTKRSPPYRHSVLSYAEEAKRNQENYTFPAIPPAKANKPLYLNREQNKQWHDEKFSVVADAVIEVCASFNVPKWQGLLLEGATGAMYAYNK